MEWILIFYLKGANAGGPATAVFSDEKACLSAVEVIKKASPGRAHGEIAVCVPKGTITK